MANRTRTKSKASLFLLEMFSNLARTDADTSLGDLLVTLLPPGKVVSHLPCDKPWRPPRFHPSWPCVNEDNL
ncbi:MAG: hypothetical protein RL240_1167 [Planctomycetota bacterium]|jgi:hypothetical protein